MRPGYCELRSIVGQSSGDDPSVTREKTVHENVKPSSSTTPKTEVDGPFASQLVSNSKHSLGPPDKWFSYRTWPVECQLVARVPPDTEIRNHL